MREELSTSITFARNKSATCTISERVVRVAFTFTKISSRATNASSLEKSFTSMTFTSLLSCLTHWSTLFPPSFTVTVMREYFFPQMGPTLRVSILNPLPLNIPATLARTPNLFSTSADIVWFIAQTTFTPPKLKLENARNGVN